MTIVYDGDGNRVSKTAGGVTTKYLVDDRNLTVYAQVLEETVGGTVQRVYTYGLNRISQSQASGTSFYGYDGHGNVRILTDATGAVTDRYDYDAFGNVITQTGTTPNVYLYSGEQNDPHIGLYYLRARYLSQSTGRFWTMDSVDADPDSPASLHRYLYASGDPANQIDPSGNVSLVDVVLTSVFQDVFSTLSVMNPLRGLADLSAKIVRDSKIDRVVGLVIAAVYLEARAPSGSPIDENCAKWCRTALGVGGFDTGDTSGRPGYAKDYGPFLVGHLGAVKLPTAGYFGHEELGDVAVIQPPPGLNAKGKPYNPAGHIQMFIWGHWVSNYIQPRFSPFTLLETSDLDFAIYRLWN